MNLRWLALRGILGLGLLGTAQLPTALAETPDDFRALLEVAEVGPKVLSQLGDGPDYSEADWHILLQVSQRLRQFGMPRASHTSVARTFAGRMEQDRQNHIGQLFSASGIIDKVQAYSLPAKIAELYSLSSVYRCQLRLLPSEQEAIEVEEITVLATQVPRLWQTKQAFSSERVQVHGVLVSGERGDEQDTWRPLLLANHIAWFPTEGVPTGQILLAQQGMDVALLDEVRHRRPFVKPEVSREGEAFYATMMAMSKVDSREVLHVARSNIAGKTRAWRARQPELLRQHRRLETQLTKTIDPGAREKIAAQIKQAKSQRALAATIVEQGERGFSSVAPMFLQPEQEVGELFLFEGTARRAVRIAVDDQQGLGSYYEVEVYPSESRLLNQQPVVCCVPKLSPGFPTGDEIRVPVRMAGVFFKSWRYRSRNLQVAAGETGRQRQLYTPVLLGAMPTWLKSAASRDGWGAFWGGVAFLVLLGLVWGSMAYLARRDRRVRQSLRRDERIDL